MADPVTITLATPIPGEAAFGEPVRALTLRAPTGRDLRRCGLPYRIEASGAPAIDTEAAARLIAELSALPPAAVDALSAPDFQAAAMAVLGFFAPAEAAGPPTS